MNVLNLAISNSTNGSYIGETDSISHEHMYILYLYINIYESGQWCKAMEKSLGRKTERPRLYKS